MIVAHILGEQNEDFNPAVADVNGDGSITVTDVTELVDNIINGTSPKNYR